MPVLTYTISGNAGVAGATLTLTGTRMGTTTSAADGTYTLGGLHAGPYTITPSFAGFTFLPAFLNETVIAANITGANFVGNPTAPNILSNAGVGVSAGSTIVNTGNTVIHGDLDLSPGSVASGFPPGTVTGVQHIDDATAVQSQLDVVTAYNQAAATGGAVTIPTALDATTLDAGVYTSGAGTFSLSGGTLVLDAQGNSNAVWIFQMATTLITTGGSVVSLINGGQAKNVFWQVGSSATIGATNTFVGTILAHTSITVNGTGTTIAGGLLTSAAVNLSDAIVTVTASLPPPSPVSVLPTSGLQGTTFNFTVTGTNFLTGTLSFSGTGITVNSYSVQNSTTITANITIAANALLSARDVIVTNSDTQTAILSAAFTVTGSVAILPYSVPDCRSSVVRTPLAIDNFHRANEVPLSSVIWTNSSSGGELAVVNDVCVAGPSSTGYEFYTGVPTPNNQYVSATIASFSNGPYANEGSLIGVAVRSADGGNNLIGYGWAVGGNGDGTSELGFSKNGSVISFVQIPTVNIGDIISLEAFGTTISALYNGVVIFSITDSTRVSGFTGLDIIWDAFQLDTSVSLFVVGSAESTTFPNGYRVVNNTRIYDVQTSSNPAIPGTDSRASKPVDSSTQPQNSRTPGTYGPGE